jgi:hypothetical protein
MAKVNYIKDTGKFWQERKTARRNLDKELAGLSYSEKVIIVEKMQVSHMSLRKAKQIT